MNVTCKDTMERILFEFPFPLCQSVRKDFPNCPVTGGPPVNGLRKLTGGANLLKQQVPGNVSLWKQAYHVYNQTEPKCDTIMHL